MRKVLLYLLVFALIKSDAQNYASPATSDIKKPSKEATTDTLLSTIKRLDSMLEADMFPMDSFFVDKTKRIINTGIFNFEGVDKTELIKRVKNWAAIKFVNLKEVLVGETDEQLVLNYIDRSFYGEILGSKYISPVYIRLVIQFKDAKIKYAYYDDGNVGGVQVTPRIIYLNDCFKEKKGIFIARGSYIKGLIDLKKSIYRNLYYLHREIASPQKNDW